MIFNLLYTYNTYFNNLNNLNNNKPNIVLLGDGFFARGFLHHINFNKFNIIQIYKDEFINPQDLMYNLQRKIKNNNMFHIRNLFYNKDSHIKIQDEVKSISYNNKSIKLNGMNNILKYSCDYLVIGLGNKKSLKTWQNNFDDLCDTINEKKEISIVGMGPFGYELGSILSKFTKIEMFETLPKEKVLTYVNPKNKEILLNLLDKKNIKTNYNMSFNHIYQNPIYCFGGAPNIIDYNSAQNFKIDKYLQSINNNNTYIGGDCTESKEYIRNAQVAYQQGMYVAKRINGDIPENQEFKYEPNGIAINVGDKKVMIEGHKYIPDGIYPDFIMKLYSMFFI
jgi:NADH dehydrogenase FAD-containing subunit